MVDKMINDARVYTDLQGLEQLRYSKDSGAAKKEIAQQFQALLMQMMFRSMREANDVFNEENADSDAMGTYQDMLDKQLSLSNSSLGSSLANVFEANIERQFNLKGATAKTTAQAAQAVPSHVLAPTPPAAARTHISVASAAPVADKPAAFAALPANAAKPIVSQHDFVNRVWSAAKSAATAIGVNPGVLVAQAALETNWGKNVLHHGNQDSTHNLFNIKADPSWKAGIASAETLEQKNGVLVKERANFRSYESFADSFKDYVSFLKNNGRYTAALSKASNPHEFVAALQEAGFATDKQYAQKVLKIFSSQGFKAILAKME